MMHEQLARRLRGAYRGPPIPPLRDGLAVDDADGPYAVQAINTRFWSGEGRRIVGGKVGLTAKAVQAQFGVDQPDFGILFDDMAIADGGVLPAGGLDGLIAMPEFREIGIVLDATSAGAHTRHSEVLIAQGKRVIDLTPAAIGPYTVPSVTGDANLDAPNVNMVTCGGQATIPMVAAVNRVAHVRYGEIVASIASKSAGPGTRANIDEFTETTAQAIRVAGGADRDKAIIAPADVA